MQDMKDAASNPCRILSLDGGGAKGFYTLGVLRELEALLGPPLSNRFDLIFGTSTGAIIAALLALGLPIDEIHSLYKKHVPTIMRERKRAGNRKHLQNSLYQFLVTRLLKMSKQGSEL